MKSLLPGMGMTPAATSSAPVYTPETPAIAFAAEVSIDKIFACG